MTHIFKHPKYYKELRKRNKTDQAISKSKTVDVGDSVRPGPGHKPQAASSKPQASSAKLVEE
jgi:ribosomal protein S17